MITTAPTVYHNAYSIDPNTNQADGEAPQRAATIRTRRGVANKKYVWPQNHTLTISYMDMPEAGKRLMQKCVAQFTEHVNLKFKFIEGSDGDIRVSGHKDIGGTWSRLGNTALNAPKDEPTMHIDLSTPKRSLERYILHEFGHALGLEHEHQHPDSTVQYHKERTYNIYKNALKWSRKYVDSQILDKVDPDNAITTPYDRKSVMHYNVNPDMTTNGERISENMKLSEGDKALLKKLYPRPPAPQIQMQRWYHKRLL